MPKKALANSTKLCYTYDKLSRLLTKTTNGFTTKYVYGLGLIGEERINSFKTYHFDFRGSTVAITGINGNITDSFKYDTYGKQIERTGTSDVIFAYNGRDGVITEPNGLIYMRARYYSPEHRRFINADVVPGKISNAITLNRFAYANGNPVSFVDPFGLSAERGQGPTVLEAAYMAEHIYDAVLSRDRKIDLGENFGGWMLYDIEENNEGMKIGIYFRVKDGITSYAVVSAGSTLPFAYTWDEVRHDWGNNLQQPLGFSTDMQDSIAFAQKFVKKHPNSHITFIGHSKGGAEAAANAVATNRDAIIFNPATVNLSAYGLDASAYSADMTAYIVNGEVLNRTFGIISSPIDKEERLGFSVPSVSPVVEVGKLVFSFVKHSMTTVIKLLEEKQGVEK